MPIKRGHDNKGSFYQWGNHGKRYYYKAGNVNSRLIAKSKAMKQMKAIFSNGYLN